MTGYTVHTGSNEDFSKGWDRVFAKKQPKTAGNKPKPAASKGTKSAGNVNQKKRPARKSKKR